MARRAVCVVCVKPKVGVCDADDRPCCPHIEGRARRAGQRKPARRKKKLGKKKEELISLRRSSSALRRLTKLKLCSPYRRKAGLCSHRSVWAFGPLTHPPEGGGVL